MSIEKDLMDLEDPLCLQKQRKINDAGESTESVEKVLEVRGDRYGSFVNGARLSQTLQAIITQHSAANSSKPM